LKFRVLEEVFPGRHPLDPVCLEAYSRPINKLLESLSFKRRVDR
jgi:hypothetical protein